MRYRELGNTGLRVSEVGVGAEWIGEMTEDARHKVMRTFDGAGVNIVDCWMADPRCCRRSWQTVSSVVLAP